LFVKAMPVSLLSVSVGMMLLKVWKCSWLCLCKKIFKNLQL